jgi:hypothetical protein
MLFTHRATHFFRSLRFFSTASKIFRPVGTFDPENRNKWDSGGKTYLHHSKSPLWSQSSRKRPQNPALDPYMQKGPSVHPSIHSFPLSLSAMHGIVLCLHPRFPSIMRHGRAPDAFLYTSANVAANAFLNTSPALLLARFPFVFVSRLCTASSHHTCFLHFYICIHHLCWVMAAASATCSPHDTGTLSSYAGMHCDSCTPLFFHTRNCCHLHVPVLLTITTPPALQHCTVISINSSHLFPHLCP